MRRKTIPIPGSHDFDFTSLLPIVDHPRFQSLKHKKQLGLDYQVFPDAAHSRFVHSLSTGARSKERAQRWKEDGTIDDQDARDMTMLGLLHDIGHGPYSHLSEDLCGISHKERGRELLEELRGPIEQCGGDFDNVCELFEGKNPLAQGVSHHPLGTDKLDYLMRDGRHTNEAVSLTVGVLLNFVYFVDNRLGADISIIDEVMQTQRFYVYMYGRVYWRKTCLIAERFFQKILGRVLSLGELACDRVLEMGDNQLDAAIFSCTDPVVQEQWWRFQERKFPKQAVVLSANSTAVLEAASSKPTVVNVVDQAQLNALECLQQQAAAEKVESEVAQLLGIPVSAVVITPPKPPHRFLPPDIPITDGRRRLIETLYQLRPKHYESLHELAVTHTAVRVCVYEEYRKHAAAHADAITQHVLAHLVK